MPQHHRIYERPPKSGDLEELREWLDRFVRDLIRERAETIIAFADDATPSVKYGHTFKTGGTTTITDFDDGVENQTIVVIAEHSVTVTHGTNIYLNGDANYDMVSGDTLTLICKSDNKWYELSRGGQSGSGSVSNPLNLGTFDVTAGRIRCYAGVAGTNGGGPLILDTNQSHDTTIYDYRLTVWKDDLQIGSSQDTDIITLQGGGATNPVYITDGSLYVKCPTGDIANVEVGQEGNHRGSIKVYGDDAGTDYGGSVYLYTADDYDGAPSNINNFSVLADADDLTIGPNTDPDSLIYRGATNDWVSRATGGLLVQTILKYDIATFDNADATPSVSGASVFQTTGTTTITDFDDGVTGQVIIVLATDSITITDGTNIFLNGSANFDMTDTDTLTLICKSDNKWYELARGDNGA